MSRVPLNLACIASPVTALHEANSSRSSRFRRPSEAPTTPSQQTRLNSRSVLAGKAARPSSLILGQHPSLKYSKAGCCLSTCTRSSSDIRDLHGPNSMFWCYGPMAHSKVHVVHLQDFSIHHIQSAAESGQIKLSEPLLHVSTLQHFQKLYCTMPLQATPPEHGNLWHAVHVPMSWQHLLVSIPNK